MDIIERLKKDRVNLQLRIKEWYDKGKDATALVHDYHELLNKLRSHGIKAEVKAEYLQKYFWDNKYKIASDKKIQLPIEQSKPEQPKHESIKPSQDSFILCLAWSELNSNESTPAQIKKVMDYFNELCLPLLDEDINHIDNRIEHIMRYEFKGSEESFRLLKLCTQFVLDAFAQTDFERFNIAIYGKKKNY